MHLQQAIANVFEQLSDSLEQLSPEEYTQSSRILFDATIGQHVRHIVELFLCLDNGYEAGTVNYEKRNRDRLIETNKQLAGELLQTIYLGLGKPNKKLLLEAAYNDHAGEMIIIESNYYREMAYNLEHTVHHMALIRVGINEVATVRLPEGYGIASSTIKYQRACAQ